MSKISLRLTIFGASIAVIAGLVASMAGAAAAATTCTFTMNAKTKTMSLVADCTTDTTIFVPDGWTLDGKGYTITAVDGLRGRSTARSSRTRHHDERQEPQDRGGGHRPNNCVASSTASPS